MDEHHSKFKHPFSCLVSGPSGSGKTILVRRILKNFKACIYNFQQPVLRVLWSYGQWHHFINVKISDNVIVHYHKGIINDNVLNEFKPHIIVFDDLLDEIDKNKYLENMFTKKSHHLNISVFFLVQNLFFKTLRTISLNANYIILMKNPRDGAQIMNLARQIFPKKSKRLTEAYDEATKEPYGYIVIDLKPDTPDSMKLRTRITSEEVAHLNRQFYPIIYEPML